MRSIKKGPQPHTLCLPKVETEIEQLRGMLTQGGNLSSRHFKSVIYAADDVKAQLRNDQEGKCAYCDTFFVESTGEVEHFRPKTAYRQQKGGTEHRPGYYALAYAWENLLLACPCCNRHKGTVFALFDESQRATTGKPLQQESPLLINPYTDRVEDFFEFYQERIIPHHACTPEQRDRAKHTIELLGLNRPELLEKRNILWKIYQELCTTPQLSHAAQPIIGLLFKGEYTSMFHLQEHSPISP